MINSENREIKSDGVLTTDGETYFEYVLRIEALSFGYWGENPPCTVRRLNPAVGFY